MLLCQGPVQSNVVKALPYAASLSRSAHSVRIAMVHCLKGCRCR